jgi:hypothetical protein
MERALEPLCGAVESGVRGLADGGVKCYESPPPANPEAAMKLEGSCHCGAVRFSVEAPSPVPFVRCDCSI